MLNPYGIIIKSKFLFSHLMEQLLGEGMGAALSEVEGGEGVNAAVG